jgi:hypothetical protein
VVTTAGVSAEEEVEAERATDAEEEEAATEDEASCTEVEPYLLAA